VAHAAAAADGWGNAGLECRPGPQRGRCRPPPAAPGTPAHAARADPREPSEHRAAGGRWHAPGVARRGGDPTRCGPPGGRAAAARGGVRSPAAGVAAGPAAPGAEREPGGRATRGVAHQGRAGAGAGPPGGHAARAGSHSGRALCEGMVRVARWADANAGGRGRGPAATPLPEWTGCPSPRDDAGRAGREADHGHRDGLGRGARAPPGLHRRRERRPERVLDPARSPRRAGRVGPESATAQEATSTGWGTRSRRAVHRDEDRMKWGRQEKELDKCGHIEGPPLSRDRLPLGADFWRFSAGEVLAPSSSGTVF
jgi:hypothetical protein